MGNPSMSEQMVKDTVASEAAQFLLQDPHAVCEPQVNNPGRAIGQR